MKKDTKNKKFILDINLPKELLEKIDECNFIKEDKEYLYIYNLLCATAERIETCDRYINNHLDCPKTEEEFIIFFMFAGMLYDCIKKLTGELNIPIKKKLKTFKSLSMQEPIQLIEDDEIEDEKLGQAIDDNKMFEYLRSLIFAHPTDTDRARFLKRRKEHQVSPWVIIPRERICQLLNEQELVGIRIYSDKTEYIQDIKFPFENLLLFIKETHNLIEKIIIEVDEIIKNKNREFLKVKVKREGNIVEVLTNIKNILLSRFEETYDIEYILEILQLEPKNKKNEKAFNVFIDDLIKKKEEICDAVDNLDNEALGEITSSFLYPHIDYGYNFGNYHHEKIMMYLDKDGSEANLQFAKECLQEFYKKYAKKLIFINFEKMEYNEIKSLIKICDYVNNKNIMSTSPKNALKR